MPELTMVTVGTKVVRLLRGGGGPPVLYLHAGTLDAQWGELHEDVARHFTVLLPAHPGFMESTGLEEVDGIFDLVLHYADLLDVLGHRALPVVGSAFGGWIAAELAALYPARVAKLALIDSVGICLDAHPMGELFGTPPPELAKMLFHDQSLPIAQMMQAIVPGMVLPEQFVLPELKALEATAKVGWNPYLHDPKLEGRLRRVTAPTLVVWGKQDGLVPLAYGERFRDRIPGARLEVIDACGHLPVIERPAELAALLTRFLA